MRVRAGRGVIGVLGAMWLGACAPGGEAMPPPPGVRVAPVAGAGRSAGGPGAVPTTATAPSLEGTRSVEPPLVELSPALSSLLHSKMERHEAQLDALLEAALRLDRPRIGAAAAKILEEGGLARPGPDDADLMNALVEKRFYDLQDEMREATRALAAAAAVPGSAAIATSFALLASSCIRCHAEFLPSPDGPRH